MELIAKSVRFRPDQIDKAEQERGSMSFSEYVRMCMDFFSKTKHNLAILQKIGAVETCMGFLEEYKGELNNQLLLDGLDHIDLSDKNGESVIQNVYDKEDKTVCSEYKNESDVIHRVIQNDEEVSDKKEESVIQMENDPLYQTYEPYLELMAKQLNTHNRVEDHTKKKITSETATKPNQLDTFLFMFKNNIRKIDYSISREKTLISGGDGRVRKEKGV